MSGRLLDALARPAAEAAADVRRWHEERDTERLLAELDALPGLIAEAVERAYTLGTARAKQASRQATAPARASILAARKAPPCASRSVAWLRAACASPQDRARVLAALRMRERDLDRILAGRVRLAPAG